MPSGEKAQQLRDRGAEYFQFIEEKIVCRLGIGHNAGTG
jgi:hypothetical protein